MSINHTGLTCDDCATPITTQGEWVRVKRTETNPRTGQTRVWWQCEQCHAKARYSSTLARLQQLGMGKSLAPTATPSPSPSPATRPTTRRLRSVIPTIRKPDL